MEIPVMFHERNIGVCTLEDDGLYWKLRCKCEVVSSQVERLYVQKKKIGVLENRDDALYMIKRISKSSSPELPPEKGYFTLHPQEDKVEKEVQQEFEESKEPLWEGEVLGHHLKGRLDGDHVLFPYEESQPCPCEPLLCFFEVKDGFWRLPIVIEQENRGDENTEVF